MSKKSITLFLAIFLVGCLASYSFGIKIAREAFGADLMEVQAKLAFDHLNRYQELSLCLQKGKFSEAKEKLMHQVISERELLAGFLGSVESKEVENYIEIRSEQSIDSFKNYQSNRGSRWSVPSCQ